MLITGAAGFIGSTICSRLASDNKVVGIDITGPTDGALNITWEQADPPTSPERERWRAGLTDLDSAAAIWEKHSPNVVIHCAGIAHQKIGAVDFATYMLVNSDDWYVLTILAQGLSAGSVAGLPAVILECPS